MSGRTPGRGGSALVYSTDSGRICPGCGQPVARCACRAQAKARAVPAAGGAIRVSRETKGRAGKGVTVVRGLPLDEAALSALGKQLRTALGTGGTAKDGAIEVQGDHAERVVAWLNQQGWNARRSGG